MAQILSLIILDSVGDRVSVSFLVIRSTLNMSNGLQIPPQVVKVDYNRAREAVKFALWELVYLQSTARYLESEVKRIEEEVVELTRFVKIDYRAKDFQWQRQYARRLNDQIVVVMAAVKKFASSEFRRKYAEDARAQNLDPGYQHDTLSFFQGYGSLDRGRP